MTLVLLVTLLTLISYIDVRTYRIPNALNAALALAGVAIQVYSTGRLADVDFFSAILFFGLFLGVHLGFAWTTGRNGLGLGDVKFAGASGFWIGLSTLPIYLGLASISALAFIGLSRVIYARPASKRLAFAPFLSLALLNCWLVETHPFLLERL